MFPMSCLGPEPDDAQTFNNLYEMVFDKQPDIDNQTRTIAGYTALLNQEISGPETNTYIATKSQIEQQLNKLSLPENPFNEPKYKAVAMNKPPMTTMSNVTTCLSMEPHEEIELKPLSAYNFFFRDERDRIIKYGPSYDNIFHRYCDKQRYSSDHQYTLLDAYWKQDPSTKRKHRKSHGVISFIDLSKMVSTRWKELTVEEKAFYQQVASKDRDRYQNKMLARLRKSSSSLFG